MTTESKEAASACSAPLAADRLHAPAAHPPAPHAPPAARQSGLPTTHVLAKFKVLTVTHHEGGMFTVGFRASHKDGNTDWSKYTPNGDLNMSITNPAIEGFFKPGVEYHLIFTKAA